MAWTFTAATERALAEAAGWTSRDDHDDLHEPELLLGLLAEAECRAAEMLLANNIDATAVRARWPVLRRTARNEASREFSGAVVAALDAAIGRLWAYPRPLALATEHVLLGLVAAPSETAAWLAERGLEADRLEAQIHHLYGHDPGPLPVEPLELGDQISEAAVLAVAGTVREPQPRRAELERIVGPDVIKLETQFAVFDVAEPQSLASAPPAAESVSLLRVLDAAANRAREGLRVVEDYVRMVLDDRFLTAEVKQLRHDLQAVLRPLDGRDLLAARDTLADVGTTISTSAEFARSDLAGVAAANWKRLQEALRSLEEYSKVSHPAAAATIERLRYRSYTLERAAEIVQTSIERLALAQVCVLIDGRASDAAFERLVDALVAARTPMIQFREKNLADSELLARARLLRARTAAAGTLCIINDRADIAAAVHADGVHVGQDDLPVKVARSVVGPRALVGVSTHSLSQARRAVLEGASYLGVGPTFPSTTKQFAEFPGVNLLRQVAAEIRLPAFAIGGVALPNLESVIAAGFSRVAVSGAVMEAADPAAASAEFARRLSGAPSLSPWGSG
jgi:thiamine-phosphate pyrophosphorylase